MSFKSTYLLHYRAAVDEERVPAGGVQPRAVLGPAAEGLARHHGRLLLAAAAHAALLPQAA